MKKILTLAVALVMVFALAAPAFAAGWDKPVEPEEFENLQLELTALDVDYYNSAVFEKGYQELDKTYPVVAGTRVHAYAEITIPEWDKLSEDVKTRIGESKGKVTITLGNITVESVKWSYTGKAGSWADATEVSKDKEYSETVGYTDFGKTIYVEIWGNATKSGEAKITATLGVYNKWSGDQFSFFNKSGTEYTIFNGKESIFSVVKGTEWDDKNNVKFYVNSDGQVQMGQVVENGSTYTIVDAYGEMNFAPEGGGNLITGDTYNKVKALLDNVLNAMGFEYGGRAFITRPLITKNLGPVVEGSASLVYPSGYIQEIVTNDPGVNPPQTGDSASIAGFVMIAVALIAAAVVTVKKVRA